jgi:hypothetical protein
MGVAHVAVAMNAGQHFVFAVNWKHLVHEIRMAIEARPLRHAPVALLDLNGLVKVF